MAWSARAEDREAVRRQEVPVDVRPEIGRSVLERRVEERLGRHRPEGLDRGLAHLGAKLAPEASASARDFRRPKGAKNAPLSPIARLKRPLARGEAMSALTENEPADSPKIVTLSGSPPNGLCSS
jgi:hypothetical protein